jgi:hypothetical protein
MFQINLPLAYTPNKKEKKEKQQETRNGVLKAVNPWMPGWPDALDGRKALAQAK